MNNKKKSLLLASVAALMVGFSSCDRDDDSTVTTSPAIHSIQNQNGLSKEVADVVQVAADEYVFWGKEQQSSGVWALYAVRIHTQNGIVWEQRYNVDATTDEAVCIRLINNELWAVAYSNELLEQAQIIKIDPSNGSTLGSAGVDGVRINDLQVSSNQTDILVTGYTTDVNTNKPLFDPTTDTKDYYVMLCEPTLNVIWTTKTGWNGQDEAIGLKADSNNVNVFFKAGAVSQNVSRASVVKLSLLNGNIINQSQLDPNNTAVELLALTNQSGADFVLLSQTNAGNLVRHSVNTNGSSIVDNGNQTLSLQNIAAPNLLTSGSNYLITGNSGNDAKVYLLNSSFAVQGDVTITPALVANNASSVRVGKTIPIGNGQFLAALNYQLNGGQIAYVKLNSSGNIIP